MKLKKTIQKYIFNKPLREIYMDEILEKVSRKEKLTDKELNFIKLYNDTTDKYLKDYVMMSKNMTCNKVIDFLDNEIVIICNLTDKDGKIGEHIKEIHSDINDNVSYITTHKNTICELSDRYLYNLIYNRKKDRYSLEEHDEYFEEIHIDK